MNETVEENVHTAPIDDNLYAFMLIAGGIAIYNSAETIFLIFTQFRRYNSLYFWSLIGCSVGIFLFAVGFLDLFFKLYLPDGSILRPLFVLTIGWYGMVTGFAVVMYSRLAVISVPPKIIKMVKYFIIYNICFSHFPTTTFTFGANIIGTNFWVDGYAVIEAIQMTFFCIQEVLLSLIYLYYIKKTSMGGSTVSKKTKRLVNHTIHANFIVLVLDLLMLILEYIGLYSYQIMLKVVVYSVKLKLEFYILKILTTSLAPEGSTISRSVGKKDRNSVRPTARPVSSAAVSSGTNASSLVASEK